MAFHKNIKDQVTKYRKKPLSVEAVQYSGDNLEELWRFVPEEVRQDKPLGIRTLEGVMKIKKGDWIIKGVKDEYYPCKAEIFSETYEVADLSKSIPESTKGGTFEEWLWEVAIRVSVRLHEEYGRVVYVTTHVSGKTGTLGFYCQKTHMQLKKPVLKSAYAYLISTGVSSVYVDTLVNQLAVDESWFLRTKRANTSNEHYEEKFQKSLDSKLWHSEA